MWMVNPGFRFDFPGPWGHYVVKFAWVNPLTAGRVVAILQRTFVGRNRVVLNPVFANPHLVRLSSYGRFQSR